MTGTELHPLIDAAGRRAMQPAWARCSDERYQHCVRVGDLLAGWARALGRNEFDVLRWRAAGVLHDALKDADSETLLGLVDGDWPPPVLHAPACAARLTADGVKDSPLLDAIAYHPVGHPDLDELGRFLILADYLDPGRKFRDEEREALRERMPGEAAQVLVEVLARRMEKLLRKSRPLLDCTVNLWNEVASP